MGFTNEQLERYSRHIILKEIGVKGQKKLLNAKVLIIGAGGLGAPAALYLAAAGVGTIGIVDADIFLMKDRIQSGRLLFLIVLQRFDRDTGQQYDRDNVDDRLQTHRDVSKAPGHIDVVLRAEKYHNRGSDPEDRHRRFIFCDEADI